MKKPVSIEEQLASTNVAEILDDGDLVTIGDDVFHGYDIDKKSRKEWEDRNEGYIKLAAQVKESRNWPWPNSANVKYPLLSISCLQFSARAHQQLFPGPNVVKGKVIGYDKDGLKRAKAGRISKHMSYQLLDEMEGWEEDMDRALLILPICGNFFKKTYRASTENKSELVLPSDLVVNYYARTLERASRKSHQLWYYPHEIEEQTRSGEWIEPKTAFGDAPAAKDTPAKDSVQGIKPPDTDPDAPHMFIEQHGLYDLDGDSYKEPVIVTIHAETKQVVKIVTGYEDSGVTYDSDGKTVIRIKRDEYFTNFIFIPDAVSGVYGQGFGGLLGPLNETANSIINQLLDSGTLSNVPAGFLSRGVRSAKGNIPLKPGEFRPIQVPGDNIRNVIFPLQFPQPSAVMFQMLGMMLDSGRTLSSVTDLMSGNSPGQNQPHATTSDLLQQGLQVFSSIYRRVYRSLGKEYKKLFKLNKLYVGDTEYFTVLDTGEEGTVNRNDYLDESLDVIPAADPRMVSDAEKSQREEGLFAFMQAGTVNPQVATKRILLARGEEELNELLQMPPPQPNPEIVLKEKELAIEEKKVAGEQEIKGLKAQYQSLRDQANAELAQAKAQAALQMVDIERLKAENVAIKDAHNSEFVRFKEEVRAMVEKYKADKAVEGRSA